MPDAGRNTAHRLVRFGLTGLRGSMLRPGSFGHGVTMTARASRVLFNPKESVGHDEAP